MAQVSSSLINAALSAKKTERALISAASASELILEVFNMTLPTKETAPLYFERPKLPPASECKDMMVPRARPKYGRLPTPKTRLHGPADGTENAEMKANSRPATSSSSRKSARFTFRSVSKAPKGKEETTEEEAPTQSSRGNNLHIGFKRGASFKKVVKAAGAFGGQRMSKPDGESLHSIQADLPTTSDEVLTGTGPVEYSDEPVKYEKQRRRTLAPLHFDGLNRSALHGMAVPDHIDEDGERLSHRQYEFKPKTTLNDRFKRLDEKRAEKARHERSKLRHESKKHRFSELPDKERSALTEAFQTFDCNGSGSLDHVEVVACLREFGLFGATAQEKQATFNVCIDASAKDDDDPDALAKVTFEDVSIDILDLALTVVPRVRQALSELRSDDLLKQFFKFDVDGSGKLSVKEVKELTRTMGLDARMMDFDGGENVQVDFETFRDMIVRCREQLERACRERERHVRKVACLSQQDFQRFRKDLVHLYGVFLRYAEIEDAEFTEDHTIGKAELLMMLSESGLAPKDMAERKDMAVIFTERSSSDEVASVIIEGISFNDFLQIVAEIRQYRQDKIKEVQLERFTKYDRDRSGSLTIGEISRVLADSGLMPKNHAEQEEIANLISAVDEDGSGVIDFAEFQELSQRIDEKLKSFRYEAEVAFAMCLGFSELQFRDLRQVFSTLDQDCSQKLDADEVRIGLNKMNRHVTHRVFEDTFKSLDTDGSGELDFLEYLEFMKMIVDQQGPLGNQEESQKLPTKPKELRERVLQRVLEYFRMAKHYIHSLSHEDLVSLFCECMGMRSDANLHTVLEVKTVGELYELAQQRDLAMHQELCE